MRFVLLSVLACCIMPGARAQFVMPDGTDATPIEHRCLASEMHGAMLAGDPAYAARQHAHNADVRHRLLTGGMGAQRSVVTIPTVVHIIHDNGAENISDAQVLDAMAHMNEAFANTGYYDPSTGVDTEIRFCLAVRDPDDEATTGINRVQSTLTDMTAELQDLDLKDLSRWEPLDYMNIWVVRSITSQSVGAGVAGYAYLPAAHGQDIDGLVVEAEYFGSSPSLSVVAVHEAGHYLGLYHTFEGGCPNGDCLSDGDQVCDTPPDQSTASIGCAETINTCTTDPDDASTNNPFRPTGLGGIGDQFDLYIDYMDYGTPACKSAFTQGQKDRMQETLAGVRNSLLQSDGCLSPCSIPFAASFTVTPPSPVIIGTQVALTNTTGPATGYTWLVNNAYLSNNTNETYDLPAEGTFTFTLIAEDTVNHCLNQASEDVEVICPGDATFSVSDNVIPIGGHVIFTNTSTGATGYEWYLDGGLHATTTNDSIVFDTPGMYAVYLVAQTPDCPNTSVTEYIQVGNCTNDGYRMNWYFGYQAALDFNSGSPVPITDSQMDSFEGTTSISDDSGQLLFYSNGVDVWDRNNNVMPNGSGLMGGPLTSSRHQALGVPYPDHPGQYLLFTTDENENDFVNGLRYSVIDMGLNGGLGDVTAVKNVFVGNTGQESMGATYHANGTDIWLVVPRWVPHQLVIYHVDASLNITSQITTFPGFVCPGSIKFSNSGKKLVVGLQSTTSPYYYRVRVYDFDQNTGAISNPINILFNLSNAVYEPEFSPDDSKLYIPRLQEIRQYDLSLTTEVAIQNSETLIASGVGSSFCMRNGPDDKMYFAWGGGNSISRLNFPNLAGAACGYDPSSVPLGGNNSSINLPLFIKGTPFGAGVELNAPDSICLGAELEMNVVDHETACSYDWLVNGQVVAPTSGDSLLVLPWSGGDSVLVRVNKTCDCGAATTAKWIHYVPAPEFELAPDTAICANETLLLDPGPGYTDHLWQDASSNSSYLVTAAGTYWLQATDPLGCAVSDTVVVEESIDLPTLDLGPNDTLCIGGVVELDAGEGFLTYTWQDNSNGQTYTAYQPGTYWVTATNGCGSATDTITLHPGEGTLFSLGEDNVLCTWAPTLLEAPDNEAHYLWQDGSTASTFLAEAPGVYWVDVTDERGCSARDTITLGLDATPPTLICPPDTAVNITGTGNTAIITMPTPQATDGCGVTLTNSFNGTDNASGTYPVGVTLITWTAVDDLGNTVTCLQTVSVSNTHGIGDTGDSGGLLVFPDPSDGAFTLILPDGMSGSIVAEVFNDLGEVVKRSVIAGASARHLLDLTDKAAGAYRLRLTHDRRTWTRTLVIAW